MKSLSITLAALMLVACSGMDPHNDSMSSGAGGYGVSSQSGPYPYSTSIGP